MYLEGYLPDRTALVDWVPESGERVLALAGFSGHGFKLAPVFGQIAADLVLAGGSGFDLTPMSAGRLA